MSKKIKVIAVLSVVLILFLLFSTKGVVALFCDNSFKEVSFDSFKEKDEPMYSVDSGEWIGGLKEEHYFQGWIFCDTENDNSDKYITIILKSETSDRCYAYKTSTQYRQDVYDTLKVSRKVYDSDNGFECIISTLNLKEDSYRLYLYCYENENNYGLINTGIIYEKSKGVLNPV